MTRYLQPVLYAEGPTDHEFLSALIERLLIELLVDVEIREVDRFRDFDTRVSGRERLVEIATRDVDASRRPKRWHVLFIHADAKGQPASARAANVDAFRAKIHDRVDASSCSVVGIVPKHETEAWFIADGDAVRNALGVTLVDSALGVVTPKNAERDNDPKATLDGIVKRATGGRQPVPRELLSQFVSFDVLRRFSQFATFEQELVAELGRLRYL